MRLCAYCQNPIPDRIRMDARFCGAECRARAYQKGLRLGFPEARPTPDIVTFRDYVLSNAPSQATRYILGLTELGQEVIWYPKAQSRTGRIRRYDGSYSATTTFSLRPFELPRVPRATIYLIEFLDRFENLLDTPSAFSAGVHVPVSSRMCLPGKTNAERGRRRPW